MLGERVGSYRIVAELGSGGMGTVYRAEVMEATAGLAAGDQVAVKVIHSHLFAGFGVFKRFLREAEVGRRIEHENVVRTFDVDAIEVDGKVIHHLVVEYVEGQTLRSLLCEMGRVPEELCRHVGLKVSRALVAIHEAGIVHRDIKPENVLITPNQVVKVMDLGVARIAEEEYRLSLTGAFVGSVLYGAPEQFGDSSLVDGRADLYSLGLTLYELVTGKHPFANDESGYSIGNQLYEDAPPASEFRPQISPFFEGLLGCLLARDPDDRLPSAVELGEILEQGEQSDWWRQRGQSARERTKRARRRVRIPRETGIYGREAELALLRSLFAKAEAGDGQVLLLRGEPGIGKTRLMDEFVGELDAETGREFDFLFGSFPPGGAATETSAYCAAFLDHFGEEDLERGLRDCLATTPCLVPAFAALLQGEAPSGEGGPLDRNSVYTAFVQTTRALAAKRPTIILIDDLHHTPEAGLALFASLALAVQGSAALLVGTTRESLPVGWTVALERLPHASCLSLPRLDTAALADLLREACDSPAWRGRW